MKTVIMIAISIVITIVIMQFIGCTSHHQRGLHSVQERDMTVGIVQKEIKIGMSGAEVAMALGSPNIITRDSIGEETWIYDKIATKISYSKKANGIGLILWSYSTASGATSTTNKTLTVVIKFGGNNLVKSFQYHTSKF